MHLLGPLSTLLPAPSPPHILAGVGARQVPTSCSMQMQAVPAVGAGCPLALPAPPRSQALRPSAAWLQALACFRNKEVPNFKAVGCYRADPLRDAHSGCRWRRLTRAPTVPGIIEFGFTSSIYQAAAVLLNRPGRKGAGGKSATPAFCPLQCKQLGVWFRGQGTKAIM